MPSASRRMSVFSTRSPNRKSRIIEQQEEVDMDLRDPEETAWKRKYRQSVNDADLAKQFAEFMSPELSKNFLEHNKTEFDNVLESRPARPTTMYSMTAARSSDELAWPDFDTIASRRRSNRRSGLFGTSPSSSISMEEAAAWRELDLSALPRWQQQPIQPPPAVRVVDTMDAMPMRELEPAVSRGSRRQRLLRPVKSLVSLFRRPSR